MDPLSVTLAAITLGTAVKDLVELGQKIHESFAKVSKNLRNAQHIAQNIVEMVEEIKDFCEEHKDKLHDMKDFCVALEGLLGKFRSFETSILPLLPKTGRTKLGPLIRGWWNNNKIEEHIASLQTDILIVMRRYMMTSTMRIELNQGTNHEETIRGLTGIAQGLEDVRKDIGVLHTTSATTTAHYSYKPARTTSDEFNSNIIMFAQSTTSTSAPMLRSDVITEEVATTVYIKVQINSIVALVERMLTMPALIETSVDSFSWRPISKARSMGIMHLRHHVVREVTNIRDLLETEHRETVCINENTVILLNDLSMNLDILGMGHESILVGNWTVTLARALFSAFGDGEPELGAYLVFCLVNQSVKYSKIDDWAKSAHAIKEAYSTIQNLRNQYGDEDRFQMLYCLVLLQCAELTLIKKSIKMSMEAIQILGGLLNIRDFTHSTSHEEIERATHPSSSFLNQLFSSKQVLSIQIYAEALQNLGEYLSTDVEHSETAVDLAYLALAVHRKLVSLHGYSVDLAKALSSLVQGETARYIPNEQLVDLTNEGIQLFRDLAEKNPSYYAQGLANLLCVKARALTELNRNTESITAWEEVFSIAGQVIQDSQLCATALDNLIKEFRQLEQYEDAARTEMLAIARYQDGAEIQAERYLHLSWDQQHLRHYKESVQAAQKSVTLFRDQAMRDPNTWIGYLTLALSDLAHCLSASGDYSGALSAWKESVSMVDNFLDTQTGANSETIVRCCTASIAYLQFSLILKDKEESIRICSISMRQLDQLLGIYPRHEEEITRCLFWAEFYCVYNMIRGGCLQDAQQYIEIWLDHQTRKLEANPEPTMASWCARIINFQVDVFDALGCTEQALLTAQNVHNVVKMSVSTSQPCFGEVIESMHHMAQLRGSLGDCGEALAIAEEALQLARNSILEPVIDGLIWALHAVASTSLLKKDYNRTVKVAQEGCKILNSPEGLKFDENSESYSFLRPSMYALLSSAEANLGRCSTAVEYADRAVESSLEIADNKLHISTATAEHSYAETRGNLAEIFLGTGCFAQARQICEERQAYFTERVETRMGDYRELAPILRMLGILCCGEGRHEEGAAAAKELARVIKTLGSAFPSLQEEVKIRLRRQVQVPILKVLNEMSDKLDCGHQSEISSLFAL